MGLLDTLVRRSVAQRGMQRGSTPWLIVGALQLVWRWYQKHGKRTETIMLGERLRPGDRIEIAYQGKPSRQTRKEVAEIARRDAAAAAAQAKERARLQVRAGKGGRRGRKASKQLSALSGTGD